MITSLNSSSRWRNLGIHNSPISPVRFASSLPLFLPEEGRKYIRSAGTIQSRNKRSIGRDSMKILGRTNGSREKNRQVIKLSSERREGEDGEVRGSDEF